MRTTPTRGLICSRMRGVQHLPWQSTLNSPILLEIQMRTWSPWWFIVFYQWHPVTKSSNCQSYHQPDWYNCCGRQPETMEVQRKQQSPENSSSNSFPQGWQRYPTLHDVSQDYQPAWSGRLVAGGNWTKPNGSDIYSGVVSNEGSSRKSVFWLMKHGDE